MHDCRWALAKGWCRTAAMVGGLFGCCLACAPHTQSSPAPDTGPSWEPGVTYSTERTPTERGYLDRRGLIHAHSVYSHDACDGEPVDADGNRNAQCLQDFRSGLCAAKHDFVFLTDHNDAFAETPFEEAFLHRSSAGDAWVIRDDTKFASWVHCQEGADALVMVGNEGELMPVGLTKHVVSAASGTPLYGQNTAESREAMRAADAIVLQAHTERFDVAGIIEQDLDGFEMYNLHANTMENTGVALELLLRNRDGDPNLMAPDLFVLSFLSSDERYFRTWGQVAARGHRHVTTMGTDCHRNTFKALLADGERGDSYRRMMIWLSNHLLIRPTADGTWDDRHAKEALRAGRLYGAFEVLGYPVGFDYHLEKEGDVFEMGAETAWVAGSELVARAPSLQGAPVAGNVPVLRTRLLKADQTGWQFVAETYQRELRHVPAEAGVYRAEVWMRPHHLAAWLGSDDWDVLGREHLWILSNPIFLR